MPPWIQQAIVGNGQLSPADLSQIQEVDLCVGDPPRVKYGFGLQQAKAYVGQLLVSPSICHPFLVMHGHLITDQA